MEHRLFIIRNAGKYQGPFLDFETEHFARSLEGETEIIPLHVPRLPDEESGPGQFHLMETDAYRAHVDGITVDTLRLLSGITQGFYFARREERVLTAREIRAVWQGLNRVRCAVESLMHYVDQVIAGPTEERLTAMRRAQWRNRDSEDVDPHYADRFW